MKTSYKIYGLMVQFLTPDAVLAATRRAREAGYRDMDAYTPHTVEGLATELGMKRSRIPSIVFIGSLVGAATGFLMQYYAMAVNYQFNSGGRPYNSWPAFIPITFELMVLVGSLAAFLSMVLLNELPHPNHPVFNVPEFVRASQDRYFLCIEAEDPLFDLQSTAEFLASLSPHGDVIVVPVVPEAEEEPEPGETEREPRVVVTASEVRN